MLGLGYRVGARLVRACPPWPRYQVAGFLGAAFYELNPFRRQAARANYAAALGCPRDDPEVGRMVRRASANYGRMLADFVLLGSLGLDQVKQMIGVEGREHLEAALARGRGAILALPHMGSWDLCGALGGVLGYRMLAVAEPMPGTLNQEVVATRSRHGLRIVMLGRGSVREIGRALEQNHVIALLCDLPHGGGVEVSFLGRRATVPGGPAALSIRYGAPILPTYSRRLAPGRYLAHIDPPLDPPPRGSARGKAHTARLMQEVMRRIEGFIRKHPDQWYAFRPILH